MDSLKFIKRSNFLVKVLLVKHISLNVKATEIFVSLNKSTLHK